MRFSADTDPLDDPAVVKPQPNNSLQRNNTRPPPKRQPDHLVADVLLEIMGWLAFIDWLALSDPLRYSRTNGKTRTLPGIACPGYSLIRATHVCRYWRLVGLENRSLWSYIPLSETLSKDYTFIDREFACRVQRSIGLARDLHVSYAECPIHEQLQYRHTHPVPPSGSLSLWMPFLPSDGYLVNILPPGYSVSSEELCPGGKSFVFYRLYPLLVDSIKRSTALRLKGRGETLTELFGHIEDLNRHGPLFSNTVMLSDFVHSTMPPSLNPASISSLPLLRELTIELMDSTNQYVFPSLPRLQKLTLIRHAAQPHLALPIVPRIFDSYTLWDSAVNLPSPVFPALMELTILAPNVNPISLHHFLIAHSRTLTAMKLETTTDIFSLYNIPSILHPANFTVPIKATGPLVPVPRYAETGSSTSSTYAINLPRLRSLSIPHLTTLLAPHIQIWACPALDELLLALPPRLPPPSTFLTTSYVALRKLVYRFPDTAHTSQTWDPERLPPPDPREVAEQDSTSRLLLSMLKCIPTLEELVVEGWVFRHIWGEVDWIESLMPPGTSALQDYGVEYDLDCIEDDPWDLNPKRKKRSSPEGRKERWQTQDGRPFSVKTATISEEGMLLDDKGERLVLLESDDEDDEGEARRTADEESALLLRLEIPKTRTKELEELLCPRLSRLELRRCFGMERSTMFACVKERMKVAEGIKKDVLYSPTGKDEEPCSPLSSPGSSRAPSSGITVTPITECLSIDVSSSGTQTDTREDITPLLTLFCAQMKVDARDCALTDEDLDDLYAKYLRGDHVLRKPRRPRQPTPLPLDEQDHWT